VSTWPTDTLLIQYPDLGSTPDVRLRVLSAIGTLLSRSAGSYTISMLELYLDDWDLLRVWIEQGHGRQFWYLEPRSIRIVQVCEKHVLIGTSLLITDLKRLIGQFGLSQATKFDEIWTIARYYVTSEIYGEEGYIDG